MFVKILGVMDMVSSVFLIGSMFHFPQILFYIALIYLAIKAVLFLPSLNVLTFFDLIIAILFFLSLFLAIPKTILIICFLFLFEKGIISLL